MTGTPSGDGHLRAFLDRRGLLRAVAYRMLGSVTEAEDVVQDAWLRWSRVDPGTVTDAEGYLVRVTIRLAIDHLRSARVRRETYVGPWLPEPVLTGPDAAEPVLLGDSVSTALLVVLETLSPLQRAVFVLAEAFGYSYAEIGSCSAAPNPPSGSSPTGPARRSTAIAGTTPIRLWRGRWPSCSSPPVSTVTSSPCWTCWRRT